LAPGGVGFSACDCGESLDSFYSLEMAFGWLVAFLNNCISTNTYGHFESFRFFNKEITLVAGLDGQGCATPDPRH
jgi:hypothetical protein